MYTLLPFLLAAVFFGFVFLFEGGLLIYACFLEARSELALMLLLTAGWFRGASLESRVAVTFTSWCGDLAGS